MKSRTLILLILILALAPSCNPSTGESEGEQHFFSPPAIHSCLMDYTKEKEGEFFTKKLADKFSEL